MFEVKSVSNNNSMIVLGIAAIMMMAALGGAVAIAICSTNNNNPTTTDFAPESTNALREYANDLCSSSMEETILYDSLMTKSFTTSNGSVSKITSVESFRDYLSSLGFFIITDDSTYSLKSYTMEYDNAMVKTEVYANTIETTDDEVIYAGEIKEFNEYAVEVSQIKAPFKSLTSTAMVKEKMDIHNIETITASTFANLSFARAMPFVLSSNSDLAVLLSNVESNTQLSAIFGGFAYYDTYESSVESASNLYVIDSAMELKYFLRTIENDSSWMDANIIFTEPLKTTAIAPSIEDDENDVSASLITIRTSSDLLNYISMDQTAVVCEDLLVLNEEMIPVCQL